MATASTATELKGMDIDSLRKELKALRTSVAKLKMGIAMQKEKDTAKYQKEKKQLARMLTVVSAKELEAKNSPTTTES